MGMSGRTQQGRRFWAAWPVKGRVAVGGTEAVIYENVAVGGHGWSPAYIVEVAGLYTECADLTEAERIANEAGAIMREG